MATAKIVTWSRPNKDGQFPIGIKIWKNRKPSYIFEGYTLPTREHWDAKKQEVKKSFPNSARLTNYLRKKLYEVTDKALEMETQKTAVSAFAIKEQIVTPIKIEKQKTVLFKEVADQYLKEQKDCGNYDVFITDRSRLRRFYEFTNNRDITFHEITVEFLRRYTLYIRMSENLNCKGDKKPLSERTITNHLVIIRTLYNRAITAKLTTLDEYPFGNRSGISIKLTSSKKMGLTEMEIQKLEEISLSDKWSYLNDARNIWLTSFYFAGMRITDALLLTWSDFQNGRYYYTMSKNGEAGSLKVSPKVLAILEQYKQDDQKHDLVFPFLKELLNLDDRFTLRKRISSITNIIGVHMSKIMDLLEINKNASAHKSRHSFAQRAEEKNIHPKVLQKMYRHESILTTMNYQSNFSHEKADDALDAVIGF